jgi:hypothetical protein
MQHGANKAIIPATAAGMTEPPRKTLLSTIPLERLERPHGHGPYSYKP